MLRFHLKTASASPNSTVLLRFTEVFCPQWGWQATCILAHTRFLLIQQFGFSHGKQVNMPAAVVKQASEAAMKCSLYNKPTFSPSFSTVIIKQAVFWLCLFDRLIVSLSVYFPLYILQRSTDERLAGLILHMKPFNGIWEPCHCHCTPVLSVCW